MAVKITDNNGDPRLVPDTKETNARIKSISVTKDFVPVSGNGKRQLLTGLLPHETATNEMTVSMFATDVDSGPLPQEDFKIRVTDGLELSFDPTSPYAQWAEISGEAFIQKDSVPPQPMSGTSSQGKKVVLTGLWPRETAADEVTMTQYSVDVTDGVTYHDDVIIKSSEGIKLNVTQSPQGIMQSVEFDGSSLVKKYGLPNDIVTGIAVEDGPAAGEGAVIKVSSVVTDGDTFTTPADVELSIASGDPDNISITVDPSGEITFNTSKDLDGFIEKDSVQSGRIISDIEHTYKPATPLSNSIVKFTFSDVEDGTETEKSLIFQGDGGIKIEGSGDVIEIDGGDIITQANSAITLAIDGQNALIETLGDSVKAYSGAIDFLLFGGEPNSPSTPDSTSIIGRLVTLEGLNTGTRLTGLETTVGEIQSTWRPHVEGKITEYDKLLYVDGTGTPGGVMGLLGTWNENLFAQPTSVLDPDRAALPRIFGPSSNYADANSHAGRLNLYENAITGTLNLLDLVIKELNARNGGVWITNGATPIPDSSFEDIKDVMKDARINPGPTISII